MRSLLKNIAVTPLSSPMNLLLCRSMAVGEPNVDPLKLPLHSWPFGQPVKTVFEYMNAPRTRLHALPVLGTRTPGVEMGCCAGSTCRRVTMSSAPGLDVWPHVPTEPLITGPDPSW